MTLTNIPQELPEGYEWDIFDSEHCCNYFFWSCSEALGHGHYELKDTRKEAWQHYHVGQICLRILGIE